MSNLIELLTLSGVVLVALLAIGFVFARLYKRSTKETAFVRTGLGGQKVIMDGGAIVEIGTPEHFFSNPTHDRTKLFLSQILK